MIIQYIVFWFIKYVILMVKFFT